MKCTSWIVASSAYAVDRSSSRASRGQTMRTVDESGGIENPAIAAAPAIAPRPASATARATTTERNTPKSTARIWSTRVGP